MLEHYTRTFTLVDRSWPTEIKERFGFDVACDIYGTERQSTAIVGEPQYSNVRCQNFSGEAAVKLLHAARIAEL
jgi:hypothetical protein